MKFIISLFLMLFAIYAKDNFKVELSKNNAYLNEPIEAKFILEYPTKDKIRYIKFENLNSKGFITKFIKKINTKDKNISKITYYYLFFPQKIIKTFKSQEIKIARFDPKSSLIFWKTLNTKEQNLTIHPLPSNVVITGNLELNSTFKKESNGIYNLTLLLKGLTNFSDIEPFKLDVKGKVTIYSNKPKIEYKIINDKIIGSFTQKFTILSNDDFFIDKINFSYFNTSSQMLEYLTSKSYNVKVSNFSLQNIYYLIFGFILGAFVVMLLFKLRFIKNSIPIEKKIKYAPTKKMLYKTLLPLIDKYQIDDIIKELEESIYNNKEFKISKKDILKRLKLKKS